MMPADTESKHPVKNRSNQKQKNNYVINPEQDFDLVRNPMRKQSPVFPLYRKYYRQAELFFRERMENRTTPWRSKEYYDMCKQMHRIMLDGGWYANDSLMGRVKGGKLRRATAPKSGRPHISDYAQWVADKHNLQIHAGDLAIKRVKENLPHNPSEGGHQYPIGHQGLVSYYRSATVSLNAYQGATRVEKKLKCVADLYHTMINARPFTQVNQSLFMNQVNVLLDLAGFNCVHHGHLDHLAHRFHYREFRKLFKLHQDGKLAMARYRQGEFLGGVYWND